MAKKTLSNRFVFTINALAKLTCPAGSKRLYAYDQKRPGLCICVTPAGTKSFYMYRKVDGRPRRYLLGTFPRMTVDQARDAADRYNGKVAAGHNPADERKKERGAQTFEDLFDRYLEKHAKPHNKQWKSVEQQFVRYFGRAKQAEAGTTPAAEGEKAKKVAPFARWRTMPINKISNEDVQTLHVKLGKDHGKYAANRVLSLLSAMFSKAKLPNPAHGVQKFREEQRERFLDADELPRFFKALEAEEDKTAADYFKMLLYTCARRSNVAAMAWEDVNFGRRIWTVKGEKTKNGDPLVVSLTDQAMEVLQRRWGDRANGEQFVFPSHGSTGHLVEPKGPWKRVLASAGIENFRIHDLRHTGASWMAIGGVSLPIIGKVLGHRSHQSTARYAHVNRSAAATALQAATNTLAAVANGIQNDAEKTDGTKKTG